MTRRKKILFILQTYSVLTQHLAPDKKRNRRKKKKILSPKPTKIKGTPMSLNRAAAWILLGDRTGKNLLEKLGLCEANTHRGLTYTRQTLLQNPTHFWMRNPASRGHEIVPNHPPGGNMSAVLSSSFLHSRQSTLQGLRIPRGWIRNVHQMKTQLAKIQESNWGGS